MDAKPRTRITKSVVDAATPRAKPYRLWDADLKGFGVRVTPTGVKTYFISYRAGHGGRAAPQREYTIGRHGPLTPAHARAEAERLLSAHRLGEDPQRRRGAARADLTISELCDLYLRDGIATKKAGTVRSDRSRISAHIKPLLGSRLQSSITSADVSNFLVDVAQGRSAARVKTGFRGVSNVRGGRGAATRTVGLLGAIFTFAVQTLGVRDENPVRGVKRYEDRRCDRYLAREEWAALGRAIAEHEKTGSSAQALNVIRLLLLTGCRLGEIQALRWGEVDLERGLLRLRDSKTGAKVVALGEAACALLQGITRVGACVHVFPTSDGKDGYYTGTPKVWRAVRRSAGLEEVRLHDLRHTFASLAVEQGLTLRVIGDLLGHRSVQTTMQYAHVANRALKQGADIAAARAESLLAGVAA